ncbi:putative secreted protein [Propionispora sp. 2/2-37]|uniref:Ger(x)C family spore germination protein n=1 Tax=Propionispora sp. 2/2-37 TaxID=1677858 RepID=UPI0006BB9731|nr:Ger(x)C family spore germination protein [Propionispora sp. 2/2-37]CUH95331.1 putative secreted protein [Propionispora sp. 2/2-37]
MKNVLTCIFCMLFLAGCGGKALDQNGIVGSMGIDKDGNTGEYIVFTQMIRATVLAKGEGGGVQEPPTEIVTSRGRTLSEAINNIEKDFDREPFLAHLQSVVISEQLAREGIKPVLELLATSPEVRRLAWFIVAKGTNPKEILNTKYGLEATQAYSLKNIVENRTFEASAPSVLDMIIKLTGGEVDPVAGVVIIGEQSSSSESQKPEEKSTKFSGTAVFKKDKLVGYLDEKESQGFNLINGKIKGGIISVPSPTEKDKLISITLDNVKSNIRPTLVNGDVVFAINVEGEGGINEQQGMVDFTKLELINAVEKEQNAYIEDVIRNTIDRVQKGYYSDILGFGAALHRKYPKEWKDIKDQWDSIFPTVQYTVNVDIKLRRTALLQKPLWPEE